MDLQTQRVPESKKSTQSGVISGVTAALSPSSSDPGGEVQAQNSEAFMEDDSETSEE